MRRRRADAANCAVIWIPRGADSGGYCVIDHGNLRRGRAFFPYYPSTALTRAIDNFSLAYSTTGRTPVMSSNASPPPDKDTNEGSSDNNGGKKGGKTTKVLAKPLETVYSDDDDDDDVCLAPPLLVGGHKIPAGDIVKPSWRSTLRYRPLTQVCKQIRTEYRPVWLRKSCFCMELSTITQFIDTCYPKVADYQNAPKRLFISWDHVKIIDDSEDDYDDYDDYSHQDEEKSCEDVLTDITLLVRLRAHCPTFTAKFVSHRILEDDMPNLSCEDCGHSIHCGCNTDCDHEGAIEWALWRMETSYLYLQVLNNFLANSNDYWLKMICGIVGKTTLVQFTFDIHTQRPTIYIRFSTGQNPKAFQLKNMYKSALAFPNRSGMMDLEQREAIDYVVGEVADKYTRHASHCLFQVRTYN
ncbi:hypothetical protein G6011_03091 [Alternaria panax]|uniref:Uncharacterized protein n=1 Tax=Alternaria panax TaxID=48097 RepID=A0AAD4NQI3_9PLEO|nr:hypothetical protein G6011_03091 [Alternaria panax]